MAEYTEQPQWMSNAEWLAREASGDPDPDRLLYEVGKPGAVARPVWAFYLQRVERDTPRVGNQ